MAPIVSKQILIKKLKMNDLIQLVSNNLHNIEQNKKKEIVSNYNTVELNSFSVAKMLKLELSVFAITNTSISWNGIKACLSNY